MAGIEIYTDGAARGNPGPSASGYIIYRGERLIDRRFAYNGDATNNYAEYKAIMMALGWCTANIDVSVMDAELYSDSELVVRQINGHYKVKSSSLSGMNIMVRQLAQKFKSIKFKNVRRDNIHIKAVDKQLNVLLDKRKKAEGTAKE